MSDPKAQRVSVNSNDAVFIEAEAMAQRMWYAMAPDGAQIERVASATSLALLLAQYVSAYIKPENRQHFLNEVVTNALSIVQQTEAGGAVGGVQ